MDSGEDKYQSSVPARQNDRYRAGLGQGQGLRREQSWDVCRWGRGP